MNMKFNSNIPLAVSIDPMTGHKTEFNSLDDFVRGCIDQRNFKVKPKFELTQNNVQAHTLIASISRFNFF